MEVIKSVISDCAGLSRTELANTISEILDWRCLNGKLKTVECLAFLEELDEKSIFRLPASLPCRPRGSKTSVAGDDEAETVLSGKKSEFDPLEIVPVSSKEDNARWCARDRMILTNPVLMLMGVYALICLPFAIYAVQKIKESEALRSSVQDILFRATRNNTVASGEA
jgi:hypothetical protein